MKPFAVSAIPRQAVLNNGGNNLTASIRDHKVAQVGTHQGSPERTHTGLFEAPSPSVLKTTILFRMKWVIFFARARIALSGRAREDPSCFKKRPMFGSAMKGSRTGRRSREQAVTPTNPPCTRACLKNPCGEYILRVG